MSEIKKLTHRRGQVKGKLTRILNTLQSEQNLGQEALQERYDILPEVLADFERVQFEIADLRIQEEDLDLEQKQKEDEIESALFETAYYKVRGDLRTKLQGRGDAGGMIAEGRIADNANINTRVKLPEIKLPSFGGNYESWIGFKDAFESTIHNKPFLSDIEKFQYLRGQVVDEAANVIGSLATTAENYQEAWNLLKAKYDNKRLITNTHLRELLKIAEISKSNYTNLNQLIMKVRSHTQALKVLGAPIEHWDMILIHVVSNKLDFHTRTEWEKLVNNKPANHSPTLKELLDYLTARCQTLQIMSKDNASQENSKTGKGAERKVSLATTGTLACVHCQGSHSLYKCESFRNLSSKEKWDELRRLQLCSNCLRKGHISKNCTGSTCRICSKRHNTLLHINKEESSSFSGETKFDKETTSMPAVHGSQELSTINTCIKTNEKEERTVLHCSLRPKTKVILSTAQIFVYDVGNKPIKCRALLDSGSQLNLITKQLAQKLRLPTKLANTPISGVSQSHLKIQDTVNIKLESRTNKFTTILECLILPQITERLPQVQIDLTKIEIPSCMQLADPEFHVPGEIEMLIGAGLFWKLLCLGQVVQAKGQPVLQKTLLGWIVGGEQVMKNTKQVKSVCNLSIISTLDEQLEKFWKIEELSKEEQLTPEEKYCEELFSTSYKRNTRGRYKVKLPQIHTVELGDSKQEAIRRFYALETRLGKNQKLKEEYTAFLDNYERLGHMTRIHLTTEQQEVYYLPHHPVIREDSMTTKLRVVFDGSAKTSLNTSLNEKLMAGPNLQEEIINILLRFRMYTFVLTADIAQMFRQVEVAEEDRRLQRIIWKKDVDEDLQFYELNTVTYGTTCAPYLAMRCLKQLAKDDGEKYPLAAEVLLRDFYMDDVLTGSNCLTETIELQKQLTQLLLAGQFELRKWRTNDIKVLEHLSEECKTKDLLIMDSQEAMKTLGLLWDSNKDIFTFSIKLKKQTEVTKRKILSAIAGIYDPLGLIGPVIMHAKILMQELWALQLQWDESVPQSIYTNWKNYYSSLERLNELFIPRRVRTTSIETSINLHGFGDASEKGYGACIYLSSNDKKGNTSCSLICSKSRVAPLRKTTLPRLELCAALLLARLLKIVRNALSNQQFQDITLWSDSTIVLHWLKTPPSQLKTFVANRVAEIRESTIDCNWRHISSTDNPADPLSRGATINQLIENNLWWHGPNWLPSKESWPDSRIKFDEMVPEKKTIMVITTDTTTEVLRRFSSFAKLERVIGYCFRFSNNTRKKAISGALTVEELNQANLAIIRMTQQESFSEEIQALKKGKYLNFKSKIIMLKPFLDENQLIRVGGRLQFADLAHNHKHPYLLPARHFITCLIMRDKHVQMKHCGPENLLHAIRMKYWPISGRREARKITRNCISCFKYKPKAHDTLMAALPESRVKGIERPFETSGVDYAGPLLMRESRRRGRIPTSKVYIAVFVCFRTKAVHLELVTDLSTEAFLAALRRFVARRGLCQIIYSDNGTNFVGAARELRELYEFLSKNEKEISSNLASQRITWKFIPPRTPHFGGLWEAAVKSTKKHLYTVTKGLLYTYEEYYTLLVEIEAVLNSRPLTPLSSDPHDLLPLTPSHFLIGVSQLEPVTKDYHNVPDNHLSRWQHLQKVKQDFWYRWKREYLHHLQARNKWIVEAENLKINTLVLLVDDNAAPLQWTLGRVTQVHPGSDGVVRVATVKTSTGELKRSVKKLCALPFDD